MPVLWYKAKKKKKKKNVSLWCESLSRETLTDPGLIGHTIVFFSVWHAPSPLKSSAFITLRNMPIQTY